MCVWNALWLTHERHREPGLTPNLTLNVFLSQTESEPRRRLFSLLVLFASMYFCVCMFMCVHISSFVSLLPG